MRELQFYESGSDNQGITATVTQGTGGNGTASKKRRYAVHLNQDTWELLGELSRRTGHSMAALVHYLLTERELCELIALTRGAKGRRRGRPRKTFHPD